MLAGVFVEVDMVARSLLAILLIALMSGVLRGIASLSLLSGVFDVAAALLGLMGIAGFGITGPLVALIVGRHGRGLGHCWLRCGWLRCACHRTTRGEREGFFSISGTAVSWLFPATSIDTAGPEPRLLMRRKIEGTGSNSRSMPSSAVQRSTLGLHTLEQYEPLIGAATVQRIAAKTDLVRTMRVAHISSTFYGGG